MIKNEEVKEFLSSYIEKTENTGHHAGGSGHMGHIGYSLLDHEITKQDDNETTIRFSYIITIETEFTYYPDNPPEETEYEKEIVVDKNGNVISENTISSKSNNTIPDFEGFEWQFAQTDITNYIVELLSKIEWTYGENRAPIKYPPVFEMEGDEYVCRVGIEESEEQHVYKSLDTNELVSKVCDDLKNRYEPK